CAQITARVLGVARQRFAKRLRRVVRAARDERVPPRPFQERGPGIDLPTRRGDRRARHADRDQESQDRLTPRKRLWARLDATLKGSRYVRGVEGDVRGVEGDVRGVE